MKINLWIVKLLKEFKHIFFSILCKQGLKKNSCQYEQTILWCLLVKWLLVQGFTNHSTLICLVRPTCKLHDMLTAWNRVLKNTPLTSGNQFALSYRCGQLYAAAYLETSNYWTECVSLTSSWRDASESQQRKIKPILKHYSSKALQSTQWMISLWKLIDWYVSLLLQRVNKICSLLYVLKQKNK
jgi:hypothetical protein